MLNGAKSRLKQRDVKTSASGDRMREESRVLIAGARGFVGHGLDTWLRSNGIEVLGADKRVSGLDGSLARVDFLDSSQTLSVLKDWLPSVVVHAIGTVGQADEEVLEQVHVETTRVLLRTVNEACPDARVVVIGSAAEYGANELNLVRIPEKTVPHPVSAYGKSKLKQLLLAEALGQELGLDVVPVRLFNTLGPSQGPQLVAGAMIQRLHCAVTAGITEVEACDPDSQRDFLDVRDVARLIWLVATSIDRRTNRPPIQIAAGEATTIRELALELLRVAGLSNCVRYVWKRDTAPTRSIGDPTTLRTLLGSRPIRQLKLSDSLQDMWSWQLTQDTGERTE